MLRFVSAGLSLVAMGVSWSLTATYHQRLPQQVNRAPFGWHRQIYPSRGDVIEEKGGMRKTVRPVSANPRY